nr:retrovirus-related Pol polyprotein from transposon 17.6 [Tanacetum cinerariifolium]
MPFGLCNALATFQRCMLAIFYDMVKESVKVFMDDFFVFGNSFDNCLNNIDKMLQRCKDAHLVLNWEKCHFMVKEGIVLGHKVFEVGLKVDKVKIDVIFKLPPPTNIKGIRSFIGHGGFYQRFIKDFSKITRPLTKLLEKDTPFEFNDKCHNAFKLLKEKLTCAPMITSPNWNLPFELVCYASNFAVGAILDHSALRHLFKKQDVNPCLIRWILLLQEFDIKIKDRKGTENVASDHLSQIENDETSDDSEVDDNFLGETLMKIDTRDEPWFADFANYLGKLFSKNGYDVLDMALPPRDQRHQYLRFEGLRYTNADITDLEKRLGRIYGREIRRVQVFDFKGLTKLMVEGLSDPQQRGSECLLGRDLICGRFIWHNPSYTLIRDLMLRMCHRMIACSIIRRSQAPKKVTVTDLFYLRGMDVGSVNIPYLFSRYLRLFALRRKRGAMIYGGQLVTHLAKHFGLLTKERLQGLLVIVRDLLMIDMFELVRLQICEEIDDTWAWVASGLAMQHVATAGALVVVEGALDVDEGDQAVLEPVHAPQAPPTARPAMTMAQRLARLGEDVYGIRGAIGEQREVLDSMAWDFSIHYIDGH